ncbi:MAG: dihydroorotase [Clostridia bacterium]|nr:dihydroorotase [Clostridia bacterium]
MKELKAKIIAGTKAEREELFRLVSDFDAERFNSEEFTVLPGFCDVHVHFREPGFSYKETILSGSRAAARGGYTAVFTMPNLSPVPDSAENLQKQLDIIEKDACIAVYPYCSITKGELGEELSDMENTAEKAVAFSDDGRGVQSEELMRAAMKKAKELGKIIVAHCEANELFSGGYIHDGAYAKAHGHKGICSASEYVQVERDVKLAEEIGCAYHVCHVSTKESVEIIRKAKKRGADVSCETAPHYLTLDENDLKEEGRFKMNPPLRSREDRFALIEGIKDGTIDMIATDHAPHSAEEKAKGLKGSAFGITGLETAFPILYTRLVREGIISAERLVSLLSENPKKRFNVRNTGFSVWKLDEKYKIDSSGFLSKGKATPFDGEDVFGRNYLTVYNGKAVYEY